MQKADRLGQWREDRGEQPLTFLPSEACHAGLGAQLAGVSMRVYKCGWKDACARMYKVHERTCMSIFSV